VKALIVREPWIGLILAGTKTWEMRRRGLSHRGERALVRSGSGLVVGLCDLVDSLPGLDREAFDAAEDRHGIAAEARPEAFRRGWNVPWVVDGARPLSRPVPYRHPQGAVTFVNLSPDEAAQVRLAA
jgi:hypothetical protein